MVIPSPVKDPPLQLKKLKKLLHRTGPSVRTLRDAKDAPSLRPTSSLQGAPPGFLSSFAKLHRETLSSRPPSPRSSQSWKRNSGTWNVDLRCHERLRAIRESCVAEKDTLLSQPSTFSTTKNISAYQPSHAASAAFPVSRLLTLRLLLYHFIRLGERRVLGRGFEPMLGFVGFECRVSRYTQLWDSRCFVGFPGAIPILGFVSNTPPQEPLQHVP